MEKRMNTWLLLVCILVLAPLVLCFSSCGSGSKNPSGKRYDAGNVSVLCPRGWMAFPAADSLDEYSGLNDPNSLHLHKGARDDSDLIRTPGIEVTRFPGDVTMVVPGKDLYQNSADLPPQSLGGRTWQGFSAVSFGAPMVLLWTRDGGGQLQAVLWTNMGGTAIALADADVQAILASIEVSDTVQPTAQ